MANCILSGTIHSYLAAIYRIQVKEVKNSTNEQNEKNVCINLYLKCQITSFSNKNHFQFYTKNHFYNQFYTILNKNLMRKSVFLFFCSFFLFGNEFEISRQNIQ